MPTPGPLELVIILVIALIVLGPGRLPDVGSALGKSIREFRKASSDIQEATRIDTSPIPAKPTTAATAPSAPSAAPANAETAAPPAPEAAAPVEAGVSPDAAPPVAAAPPEGETTTPPEGESTPPSA